MRFSIRKLLTLVMVAVLLSSCGSREQEPSEAEGVAYYDATGTVVEVLQDHVRIDHDEIPGFMGAMTMSFEVADAALLVGVKPGMDVSFRVAVSGRSAVIDRIGAGERPR